MKITVTTRTLNESKHVEKFMLGYGWADNIVVIDGGSTDDTLKKLSKYPNVIVYDSPYKEYVEGHLWNRDNDNIQYAIDKGIETDPDFLILDDFDDWPNRWLRENARNIIAETENDQINCFRLYMWNNDYYFPLMNNYFDMNYTSLWGFNPNKLNIYTDKLQKHGTILGLSQNPLCLNTPYCLLHYSWNSETIEKKIKRYNDIGLPMNHPFEFAGELREIEEWMTE